MNVVRGKPTSQSSTSNSVRFGNRLSSSLAVDGSKDTDINIGRCTSTNESDSNSWIAVDLVKPSIVTGMSLTNLVFECGKFSRARWLFVLLTSSLFKYTMNYFYCNILPLRSQGFVFSPKRTCACSHSPRTFNKRAKVVSLFLLESNDRSLQGRINPVVVFRDFTEVTYCNSGRSKTSRKHRNGKQFFL